MVSCLSSSIRPFASFLSDLYTNPVEEISVLLRKREQRQNNLPEVVPLQSGQNKSKFWASRP